MTRSNNRRRIALTVVGGVLLVLFGAALVMALMLYARSQRPAKRRPKTPIAEANPLMGEIITGGLTGEALPPARPEPGATNVVLAVIDTERRDVLGAYTPGLETSPFFDSVAADGILFTRVFSVSSWTTPAMYSMMTGVYPSEHGVVSGTAIGEGLSRRVKGQEVLPEEATTLAERLKAAGYATFGINTNFHMHPKFGFAQGFDRYAGEGFAFLPYPNMMAAAFAPEVKRTAKHFVWLHYFDPHFPYRAIAPHFDRWNTSSFATPIDFSADLVRRFYYAYGKVKPTEPIDPRYVEALYGATKLVTAHQNAITTAIGYLGDDAPVDDYRRFLQAAYLSEVRGTDDALKEALGMLGVDDETLLVITSDHGEEFLEHGRLGHRFTLYQEVIHVPLVIRLPGKARAGTVIDTPVSILDIVPTILDLVGETVPEGLSGVSLVPLIEGGSVPPRPLYAEVRNRVGGTKAITEYPWKLILTVHDDTIELYNLETDPAEKNDLAADEPARTSKMRARLEKWLRQAEPRWETERAAPLSPEELKRLKQMGYIQ